MNEDEEAELRRHGSGADGSLDWAAETGMSGRCELMRGPSEEKRGERSQPLPPGTGDAHEREKIKKSREIRRSGGQGVDLNGQRSGRPIQMNAPDSSRHHRCADLPEAVGGCGEPADAGREVANGRAVFAGADVDCVVIRDAKNAAQAWQ